MNFDQLMESTNRTLERNSQRIKRALSSRLVEHMKTSKRVWLPSPVFPKPQKDIEEEGRIFERFAAAKTRTEFYLKYSTTDGWNEKTRGDLNRVELGSKPVARESYLEQKEDDLIRATILDEQKTFQIKKEKLQKTIFENEQKIQKLTQNIKKEKLRQAINSKAGKETEQSLFHRLESENKLLLEKLKTRHH